MVMEPKKKKKTHIPFRLNAVFLTVFILFSILILRLGVLQIVNGEQTRLESEATIQEIARKEAPRGKIYDRNQRVVVDNHPYFTLTYTKTKGTSQNEMLKVAQWLSGHIQTDDMIKSITQRDKKDYFILKTGVQQLIDERFSPVEKKLKDQAQYQALVNKITSKDLESLTANDLKILAIKRAMDAGYEYSAQPVKKNLNNEEIAVVSENLGKLPGVDIAPDSVRVYPYGNSLQTIFGTVGSLPKDGLDHYLSLSYDRSDQVGTSGLEKQYQEVLRGTKEISMFLTNPKDGSSIGDPKIIPGKRGKDLILTVDMELQYQLEKILQEELLRAKSLPGNEMLDSAYIVMMNPKTGEVVGIAGKKMTSKGFENDSYGALFNAYPMGSTVKGATVLTGYYNEVLHFGDVIVDKPLVIGNIKKKSWKNLGPINDLEALQYSSNVYMFNVMERLIGPEPYSETYNKVRYYFSQFGLGEKTGIDFPDEATGYKGQPIKGEMGTLLDMGIGQFDTYTPIQMVQYISTIANGGYRVKPELVKEIREPRAEGKSDGKLLQRFEPVILNRIDMNEEQIHRVQQGMYRVMHSPGGTAYGYFTGPEYHDPAGKTGTAQVELRTKSGGIIEKNNLTLVGFAPFNNPQIAFAVVVPNGTPMHGMQNINKYIGQRALAAYWDLQKKYAMDSQSVISSIN